MEADAKTNTVMFTARSKGCVLQIRHGCRVEQEGKALLFAAVFQRMLELFSDEATSVATDDRRIEVRNAKSAYEFALMDVSKYPKADQSAPEQLLDCENFSEISTKVLFSAARGESTRPQLKCVRLQVHDGRFSASSCDGYRMTVASETAAQDAPLDVLIEADVMKTLLAVFRGIPHCKIGIDDGQVLFLGPGLVFTASLSSYTAINLDTLLTSFRADSALHLDGAAFQRRTSADRCRSFGWCQRDFANGGRCTALVFISAQINSRLPAFRKCPQRSTRCCQRKAFAITIPICEKQRPWYRVVRPRSVLTVRGQCSCSRSMRRTS